MPVITPGAEAAQVSTPREQVVKPTGAENTPPGKAGTPSHSGLHLLQESAKNTPSKLSLVASVMGTPAESRVMEAHFSDAKIAIGSKLNKSGAQGSLFHATLTYTSSDGSRKKLVCVAKKLNDQCREIPAEFLIQKKLTANLSTEECGLLHFLGVFQTGTPERPIYYAILPRCDFSLDDVSDNVRNLHHSQCDQQNPQNELLFEKIVFNILDATRRALSTLYNKGIYHGDLKLSNLCNRSGNICGIDLGCAETTDGIFADPAAIGTPLYRAPEKSGESSKESQQQTPYNFFKADIYSVGQILKKLLNEPLKFDTSEQDPRRRTEIITQEKLDAYRKERAEFKLSDFDSYQYHRTKLWLIENTADFHTALAKLADYMCETLPFHRPTPESFKEALDLLHIKFASSNSVTPEILDAFFKTALAQKNSANNAVAPEKSQTICFDGDLELSHYAERFAETTANAAAITSPGSSSAALFAHASANSSNIAAAARATAMMSAPKLPFSHE